MDFAKNEGIPETFRFSKYTSHLRDLEKKTSFVDREGGRKLNDPFDPYGSLR